MRKDPLTSHSLGLLARLAGRPHSENNVRLVQILGLRTLRQLIWVLLPFIVVLVIGKFAKLALLWFVVQARPNHTLQWLVDRFLSYSSPPVIASVWVGLLVWRRAFKITPWLFPVALVGGFISLKLLHGLWQGHVNLSDSDLVRDLTFEIHLLVATFAADVGFILLACGALALALYGANARARSVLAYVVLVAVFIAASLASLDIAYFSKTGQNGTLQTLEFSLRNAFTLAPMLQSEITGLTLAFLLLGPLTTVLVAPRLVRQVKHARIRDLYLPGLVSLVLLGLVLQSPFVVQSPSPMYASFARSVFAGMVDDIWFNPLLEVRREVLGEIDRAGKPNWNSTNAKALATPTTEKLNVVIVMLESARATSTSLYNKSLRTTPFLESLAKDSAVADSMYVVVPRTASAWISILYGLYPIDDISMRPWIAQQATRPISRGLADVLRDHGYRSAFFTSIGLNLDKERDIVTNMRFDLVITKEDLAASPGQWRNYMGLEDKVLLAPIDKWMRAQHAERNPFLLVVMTNIGHHDWKTPPTWPQQDFVDGANKNRALNSYLNSLAYIDSFIEKLFDSISAAGLADSTIVVVVGDHGESMGEHDGAIAVRTFYEESIHVPALIYAPRFKGRAARIPGVRQQVDLFPTIMQLLGYEIADAVLPGTSLLADVPADRKIYLGSNIEQSFLGAMQGGGKYVYYFRRRPIEYFNLREDPMEQRPRFVEMRSAEERAIERELLLWYERAAFSLIPPSVRSRY